MSKMSIAVKCGVNSIEFDFPAAEYYKASMIAMPDQVKHDPMVSFVKVLREDRYDIFRDMAVLMSLLENEETVSSTRDAFFGYNNGKIKPASFEDQVYILDLVRKMRIFIGNPRYNLDYFSELDRAYIRSPVDIDLKDYLTRREKSSFEDHRELLDEILKKQGKGK